MTGGKTGNRRHIKCRDGSCQVRTEKPTPQGQCCGEQPAMIVRFTDGSYKLVCPAHARQYAPTVVRPPWYGDAVPPLPEGVLSINLWPEQE